MIEARLPARRFSHLSLNGKGRSNRAAVVPEIIMSSSVGNNVSYEIKGTQLIITCDISQTKLKAAPLSGTGKTKLVASTGAPVTVNDKGLKLSLNLMTPAT